MGLFDRIHRTVAGSVLQPYDRATVGVDFNRQCIGERRLDGDNVARTDPPRWLPLAMDSQLGGDDCYQHVALPVVGVVEDS